MFVDSLSMADTNILMECGGTIKSKVVCNASCGVFGTAFALSRRHMTASSLEKKPVINKIACLAAAILMHWQSPV